jgi:tRNA threonylcarbamoyladenosine biosynthesis protein TsaB
MLLAIDTSTSYASLALLEGAQPVAGYGWHVGQNHSVEIFTELERLLDQTGAHDQITAVAVATGPGSFNGTRVAVTVAKTLAFVWQVPLVGVTTLDGIAQAHVAGLARGMPLVEQGASLLAVLEAGRDELYICWYDLDARSIPAREAPLVFVRPRGAIAITTVDAITASAPPGEILVVGEISDKHRSELEARLGERLRVMLDHDDTRLHRAGGVGMLAHLRLAAGEHDDPLALEPTYVRRPHITTSTRHPVPGPAGSVDDRIHRPAGGIDDRHRRPAGGVD